MADEEVVGSQYDYQRKAEQKSDPGKPGRARVASDEEGDPAAAAVATAGAGRGEEEDTPINEDTP